VARFWLGAGKLAGIWAAAGLISGDEQAILNVAIVLLCRRRESSEGRHAMHGSMLTGIE